MTALVARDKPGPMWEAELTKLALAADELSPAVRGAVSGVLAAVLAEEILGASATTATEELLDLLRAEPACGALGASVASRRLLGRAIGARQLAVA